MNTWVLKIRIKIDKGNFDPIPKETDWYIQIKDNYPYGFIGFFPCKTNGIKHTFYHQIVGPDIVDLPWKREQLCLDVPTRYFSRRIYHIEPYDAEKRLNYHCERAVDWVKRAMNNQLIQKGDPYELPYFIQLSLEPLIAFSENKESKMSEIKPPSAGKVTLSQFNISDKIIFVDQFKNSANQVISISDWGNSNIRIENFKGLWILLPKEPFLPVWKAPSNWQEFSQIIRDMDIDIFRLMDFAINGLVRNEYIFILIGFLIPERYGEKREYIHWQALRTPIFQSEDQNIIKFRRPSKINNRIKLKKKIRNEKEIRWLPSQNLNKEQITSRGALPMQISERKIAIIGCGAIGSMIAEILTRAGAKNILLIDEDNVEIGNLTRHILSMTDIGEPKPKAMFDRLSKLTPNISIEYIDKNFPPIKSEDIAMIQKYDLIIDCSSTDKVIDSMGDFTWNGEKVFFSFSFGYKAKRLFAYYEKNSTFSSSTFHKILDPVLKKELDEFKDEEYPWEGVGCRLPVFPARADDVWIMASISIKFLEECMIKETSNPYFIVFEKDMTDGQFNGIRRCAYEAE